MLERLRSFWNNEEGQDLIEYTLLLAFVALVAAGLFIQSGQSTSGIWTIANNKLKDASSAAAASAS